ncbi:Uncharacterized protein GY17_00003061 [Cryptosporidium hominis]|uniref:Uncharacterized protein n=2 Tax=Cryptosporidium hominis TaxID=237895 RepID=A0ABX5B9Z0_CRYHO|nr:Uncharacterized protein GY17_00003061 [Cryptosporidium hominis]|eukprot:PPS93892.1 Uncharacterized protein GY17_00003061 [Cryptosporidium hominis]
MLSDFSVRISHFSKECPSTIRMKFSSYIDRIVNSALSKVNDTYKRLKWQTKYTIFLKKEYNSELLIILLVDQLDSNFEVDKIFKELRLSLESIILSRSQINNRNFRVNFKIENIQHDSNLILQLTELICNEPLDIKMYIETLVERINLKNIDFANLMLERIKTTLNDALNTILINYEDLKTLEANSVILKEGSRKLFKGILRDNYIEKDMRNLLFASTAIVAIIILLNK